VIDFIDTTSIYNKLIIHPSFHKTISELNEYKIGLPQIPLNQEYTFQSSIFPPDGKLVVNLDPIGRYKLSSKNGMEKISSYPPICAYDESIDFYYSLEGFGQLTSHSLIISTTKDYLPINYLTFYFYTRAGVLVKYAKHIRYSDKPEVIAQRDYIKDKMKLLIDNVPNKSILLIDGPLIGGDYYTDMLVKLKELDDKEIIPIFFVKNSDSYLVTDNIEEFKGKYNSDLHWAYSMLMPGERTNFFKYVDRHNSKNAKIFCYLKAFDVSPQRIEFFVNSFEKCSDRISDIMDLIYYLMLVQGDKKNPQIRPIAIAEKYARATLKLIDFHQLMRSSGIIPTMNQGRFWS
jgi:hypothetical protein